MSQGETVIFTCLGYGIPDVEITWRLNNEIVVNSSLVTVYEENYPQDDRGVVRESNLQVCSARITDTGDYTCTVGGGLFTSSATTQLTLVGKYLHYVVVQYCGTKEGHSVTIMLNVVTFIL